MLTQIDLSRVLFIDIETVPFYKDYQAAPVIIQELWEKKSSYFRKENESASDVYHRAGIYAEFGKIICICAGRIRNPQKDRHIELRSFSHSNEKELLLQFADWLNTIEKNRKISLCAHNGKEFDFPYIARRMLINGVYLPNLLDVAGKKPWEVNFLDTLELWRFGDYKQYTSLSLLATIFGITNPKSNMDGSMVYEQYWKDNNLDDIVAYCYQDVITLIQLLLKYKGENSIPEEKITIKE